MASVRYVRLAKSRSVLDEAVDFILANPGHPTARNVSSILAKGAGPSQQHLIAVELSLAFRPPSARNA